MSRFSRDRSPARSIVVTSRMTEIEAAAIDSLAAQLGLGSRSDVVRNALDLLSAVADLLAAKKVSGAAEASLAELQQIAARLGRQGPRDAAADALGRLLAEARAAAAAN